MSGDQAASLRIIEHPMVQHKLALIRDERTGPKEFRELVSEVSMLMAYEVTRDLPVEEVVVRTPIGPARCRMIAGKKLGIVPILRAGLGMVEGLLQLIPMAKVGHIGLYRDHDSLQPVQYYVKLPPDAPERDFIILDPMLATGGSAVAAIDLVKAARARSVKLMCLIAAPEGVAAVRGRHPDVEIFAAALDERLNEQAYIVPGLGDAGDRLFGTR